MNEMPDEPAIRVLPAGQLDDEQGLLNLNLRKPRLPLEWIVRRRRPNSLPWTRADGGTVERISWSFEAFDTQVG
jgi:hypothetical protein